MFPAEFDALGLKETVSSFTNRRSVPMNPDHPVEHSHSVGDEF